MCLNLPNHSIRGNVEQANKAKNQQRLVTAALPLSCCVAGGSVSILPIPS
jgi:hypothetical protein